MTQPVRWGIVGCGLISSDFVTALQNLGPSKHVVVGCAARSADSAKKFADKFSIAKYYGEYAALAQDKEVDVAYIGSINPTHYELAKLFLSADKNVLCEKPLCMSVQHTEDLVRIAKERNLFLMEGMWSRCHPLHIRLKEMVEQKTIGDVSHTSVTFAVPIADIPRLSQKSMGGGAVPDIGVYAISVILAAMGDEMPLETKSLGQLNEEGVETQVITIMKFSGNRFATMTLSINSSEQSNDAVVSGPLGTIKLHDPFWAPVLLSSPSGEVSNPPSQSPEAYKFPNSEFLKYEAEEVSRCLKEGLKESPLVPLSLSLKLAKLISQIRADVGVQD